MKRIIALPTLLVLITGCSLIPDYDRPALPVENQWPKGPDETSSTDTQSSTPAALMGWRDFFKDPTLDELIALSLENNRDLRIAAENVGAAEAQYNIDHASLFPTIDAGASRSDSRVPADVSGVGTTLHTRQYSLGLSTVSYELDLFGAIRSQSQSAYEQYLGEEEVRTSTQISLVAQVAAEYLTWVGDREALAVSQQTAETQRQSYELVRTSATGGNATELAVSQAETTLRAAEASVAQFQRQSAQDMNELVLLVGAPLPMPLQVKMTAATALSDEPTFPTLPSGLPSDLLDRRPDIRAAEHALLAANANIGAARAAFFPSVTLTGSGGTSSTALKRLFGPGQIAWSFNPEINVPIFDAGRNFAGLDYAHIQDRIEVATYEKAIQSAFHDVSDTLVARETYSAQLKAEKQLVAANKRYFDLSNMRYKAGVDNYLNVLVAHNALFNSQLNLIGLKLAEQQNLITLYKALGGGWSEKTVSTTEKANE